MPQKQDNNNDTAPRKRPRRASNNENAAMALLLLHEQQHTIVPPLKKDTIKEYSVISDDERSCASSVLSPGRPLVKPALPSRKQIQAFQLQPLWMPPPRPSTGVASRKD